MHVLAFVLFTDGSFLYFTLPIVPAVLKEVVTMIEGDISDISDIKNILKSFFWRNLYEMRTKT